jgi:hypothetical protein
VAGRYWERYRAHRVDPRGPPGWPVAGQQDHGQKQRGCGAEGRRIGGADPDQHPAHRSGGAVVEVGRRDQVLAAAFLFQFGTGPIKGFAVTLAIGLLANVFASYFVSKLLFEWVLHRRPDARLRI